jgi:hypothetical protein
MVMADLLVFSPRLNGVEATLVGSTSSDTRSDLFVPLRTVTNAGDGCVYAVIEGSSSIGVSLKNDSLSMKRVEVRASNLLALDNTVTLTLLLAMFLRTVVRRRNCR